MDHSLYGNARVRVWAGCRMFGVGGCGSGKAGIADDACSNCNHFLFRSILGLGRRWFGVIDKG
jgi:hypothetical protein